MPKPSTPETTHYDPSIDLDAMENLPNYYRAMFDFFRPHLRGHGVEFGAGYGTVAAMAEPHLERLELVEPATNLVLGLKEKFANSSRITVTADTLENSVRQLGENSRDTVILINVLEHIENDADALAGLFRILRPGGTLLLFVPALSFLFSKLDEALGHYRRYHLGNLRSLVKSAGFEITMGRYFDLMGILPWWLFNTLGGKTRLDPRMVGYYDSLVVPLCSSLERLIPPPAGKNILMIAKRPEKPAFNPANGTPGKSMP